jgi:hypothetical protein
MISVIVIKGSDVEFELSISSKFTEGDIFVLLYNDVSCFRLILPQVNQVSSRHLSGNLFAFALILPEHQWAFQILA